MSSFAEILGGSNAFLLEALLAMFSDFSQLEGYNCPFGRELEESLSTQVHLGLCGGLRDFVGVQRSFLAVPSAYEAKSRL